jgi:hypothetical protein
VTVIDATTTNIASDGAQLLKGALKPCMAALEAALADVRSGQAGARIHDHQPLRRLLAREGCMGAIAADILGAGARAVRAILFNKTVETNWSLGWHQDRTICVKQRAEVRGFGPWTLKDGVNHVEPPSGLLSRMVTLRAHLDDVPASNGPLLIAPGSHTLGRIPVSQVHEIVSRCGTVRCLAEAGDVWVYSTPILHASQAASGPTNRRVLQVDFAAEALPDGLEWLGI